MLLRMLLPGVTVKSTGGWVPEIIGCVRHTSTAAVAIIKTVTTKKESFFIKSGSGLSLEMEGFATADATHQAPL